MPNAAEVARRLGEQAEAVCRYYLPNGRRQGRYWLVGDVAGVPGRSLYVRLAGGRAGKWTDAATGKHGDLIDLIALNRGLDFRGALAEARSFLRLPIVPSRPTARQPPAPTASPEAARRLFAASLPLKGSLAEAYLRQRGIVLPVDHAALRFHPRCYYRGLSGRETWPALIAAVTDLDGHITGAHRTWLDRSGRGKAPVDQPRRAMGHLAGHGARFGIARDVLTAAEGIETTMALKTVMPAMPMVAALSAAHLAALILPAELRRLYVARDNDEAGRVALARLREGAGARGVDVRALEPKAEDFNADLLILGPERLRAWLAEQLAEDDIRRFLPSQDWPS
jgi:hypothetical protein